jgi:hypothetical protein
MLPSAGPSSRIWLKPTTDHRSSAPSKAYRKSGSFPPPALPSLGSNTTLSDARRDHRQDAVGGATSGPVGPPPIARLTLPTCRAHYPDGPERVRLSVATPSHLGLPRYSGGSASMTSLSRPAQASLTFRPAGLLNRPKAAFVTRLRPAWLPETGCSSATRVYRQLPRWILPPLVARAFGTH